MSNIKLQLYQKANDNKGTETDLQQMIETIAGRTGASANIEQKQIRIRELLKAGKDNEASELKRTLPGVTWCGTFAPTRAIKNLQQYNPFQIFDIDKLQPDELATLVEKLKTDPYIFLFFISPSGNGIKGLIRTAAAPAQHKEYFTAVEKYFADNYKAIDESGKDVSRLCFLPVDYNLYHNPKSKIFVVEPPKEISEDQKQALSKTTKKEQQELQSSGQTVNDIYERTLQYRDYKEGDGTKKSGRNNFIFKFACNCNRVGISEMECLSFAEGFANDKPQKEIKSTIASAYKTTASEAGKFKNQSGNNSTAGNKNKKGTAANGSKPNSSNAGVAIKNQFWKKITFKKGRGDDAYEVTRYELVRRIFLKFLDGEGFNLMRTGEKGYEIVYHNNGILKPVEPEMIKHHVKDWCQQQALDDVEEMILKGQKNYFSLTELNSLPYKEFTIVKDTEQQTNFYFKNCSVSVDADGNVKTHKYSNTGNCIWDANKIPHDFAIQPIDFLDKELNVLPVDKLPCEFARFVRLASHNPKNEEEAGFAPKIITERFFSFCTSIGYLLDGWKHPAKRQGIFAVDHRIAERGEHNGRSGKSIIPKACQTMKCVATINGKTYDPRYQFANEVITVDTQIINFNDMRQNFDVEDIFEIIADDYNVNRRNLGYIHFKYISSPKVYYSTNSIPKGDGGSYRARMHCIEFSDYFNEDHTPFEEFGHSFFSDDWPADEWQRFFNFMVWCVGLYKVKGLVPYPMPNYEKRKLIIEVVPEFIDFMDDRDKVKLNERQEKISLLNGYNEIHKQLYGNMIKPHTFAKWVKQYCKNKGYIFNPKQKGHFDKSNSTEYYTIADADFKNEQTTLL